MPSEGPTAQLLRAQARAVEEWLGLYLAAHGIDPDDRSPGWEDRARPVLAELEAVEAVEMDDPYRITVTTTIRRREGS